jgi:hypothetical protein
MALLSDQFRFTRPQALTLAAGVLQLAFGWLDLFKLDPSYRVVQLAVGVMGIVMAWRLDAARLYGLVLLLGFGVLALRLHELTPESFLQVRTALIGLVITLARPAKRAPG